MSSDHPLADPAKLREIADRPTPNGLGLVLRAAADRIESAEARIAELTKESLAWEDVASGHERGAVSQSQAILDLQGQLADAKAARDKLQTEVYARNRDLRAAWAERDALAKRLEEILRVSRAVAAFQPASYAKDDHEVSIWQSFYDALAYQRKDPSQ